MKESENIKKEISDTFKKVLYYSDKKEVEISEQGALMLLLLLLVFKQDSH